MHVCMHACMYTYYIYIYNSDVVFVCYVYIHILNALAFTFTVVLGSLHMYTQTFLFSTGPIGTYADTRPYTLKPLSPIPLQEPLKPS